ncbi:uncharacterized protein LOC119330752 [Triticum dicoccoides]|uniref:Uncharacterized protein n=1 Tax=Triticum turgidum subsp. durum TaxID=4567 RepID=A0A9R0ZJH7_TRITD|nr:uncharacterized protein LOC119330752 [Triticum dicoccoides]XP_037459777.1 uncharacterized protein LOC119330752 [Triticum dicoccoides]XP_044428036.1 uncharacterized protein LOC123152596 [Triticum aestivum]VAI78825.1 unnamed protein product [Triticum turgidum subsp. durum]
MKKGALALFLILLTFASHGIWCEAARRGTMADAAHHHLRPHPQVQGLHETQGRRLLGKLEHMAGGGPGGGASGGGRNTGGGAANTRPHNTKNGGAVALPEPVTSVLALVFSTTILLSVLSF